MEMNSSGETSTEPREFENFCIREYVAEVRRKDWRKCCPFNLSGDSEESNCQADMVLASLLLENNDVLDNTPVNTEAPNFLTASEEENSKVPKDRSETLTDTVIGDDAADTINDGPSESACRRVKDSQCQNEKRLISEDSMAADNDKPQDVVIDDDAANTINDGPSKSASCKVKNAQCQYENRIFEDSMAVENDKTQDMTTNDDATNTINDEPSESASSKVKDARCQNATNVSEDAMAAENNKPQDTVIDDDTTNTVNDGPSESASNKVKDTQCQNETGIIEDAMATGNGKRQRNLARRKPQKFRLISDLLKELAGPCDARSAANVDSKFITETEDDSDGVTLGTFMRERKGVRVTSKRNGALKNKRKTHQVVEPRLGWAKRSKPVSEDSRGNDSELGSKYHLRKTRIDKPDLQMTNKCKKSSAEIRQSSSQIVPENKGAPSSLGGKENLGTQKDSLYWETVQEDCGREVLKLSDGSQRPFTAEENHSRPAHGVKSSQLVQPTTSISNENTETASDCFQQRIRERSPPISYNESMAALQLLRLSNAGVHTKTSSKTATEDPIFSVAKDKSSCGLDGVVPPASGSMVCQPQAEVNMINGAGLPLAEQTESGSSVCPMSRNPAEFTIPNAIRFMRRGQVLKKV